MDRPAEHGAAPPTWCSGVRTSPFAAHAWVEADDRPVGDPPGHRHLRDADQSGGATRRDRSSRECRRHSLGLVP
ncbi:lasso peptide biosynthesis B2 protein [Streptomyces violaceus]|uniref:lasso peptide biosynthesis B2 protein n=1 Tax=Streptomyces violaceus TaxID=1936 RepID=UPI00380B00CB